MIALPDYRFDEKIFEGSKTVIYRGRRIRDDLPVMAKCLKNSFPSESELGWFEYEFKIVKELNIPGVVKVYSLTKADHCSIIIMEDFHGVSLRKFFTTKTASIKALLEIATSAATVLGDIHRHQIIHKDIRPDNILINPETFELKLTGFSIAAQTRRETQVSMDPGGLEGTLAYISPEQTGRMNRSVDYRADFYSLGVTLYEMLTGTLPFDMEDPVEIIHAQITKTPVPPRDLDPSLPVTLSAIVMKLLSKAPEDRYQSSTGLARDLSECRKRIHDDNTMEPFEIGRNDLPEQFHPPEKLYGRKQEISMLFREFRRVAAGDTRMLLIEGPPGIGKTFLIQEIHKPLVSRRGYFISGKFDQFRGNTPYGPIVQAFLGMIRQLLTNPREQLEEWKQKLLAALSPNARVIVNLIPELALIIGEQPPLPLLGPAETLNRFNRTFGKFIRVFARPEHPLVLFIDDWQWADASTLDLFKTLMSDTQLHHLLFVGVYRDTEVSAGHPFKLLLQDIREGRKTEISTLKLSPLKLPHVAEFVQDALHCKAHDAKPLSELLLRKTSGNPFFIKQFMQSLYDDGHLRFDGKKGAWRWDLARVRAMEAAGNVVSLMIHQFGHLPEPSRHLLQLASCIGSRFDLDTLSIIGSTPKPETFRHLRIPVEKGYLLPLDSNYKLLWVDRDSKMPVNTEFCFAHDKIQQAAYALVSHEKRRPVHLMIGRLLLENLSRTKLEKRLFKVVDQLNLAAELMEAPGEKTALARLNLDAALKAKSSAAYKPSSDYLARGCALLTDKGWNEHYRLMRSLYKERAEVEYLIGNFNTSESMIRLLLERVLTDVEKAEVFNLLIVQKTLSALYDEALAAGRKGLLLLGIELPEEDPSDLFAAELSAVRKNVGKRKIEELILLPDMTDEEARQKIDLLTNLCSPAYRWDQSLFRILVLKAVNISLTHGLTAESCYTFSAYGLLLGSILGDFDSGYRFGMLALSISDKFKNPTQKCRSSFVLSSTLVHWVRHAREADPVSDQCYRIGLDSGEFQFAGYILTYKLTNQLFQGHPLPSLMGKCDRYLDFSIKTKNRWAVDVIKGTRLVLSSLTEPSADLALLSRKEPGEAGFIEDCLSNRSHSALCRFHIFHSFALYLMGHHRKAREASKAASKLLSYLFGTIYSAEQVFFDSLILLRLIPGAETNDRMRYFSLVRENQKKMKAWTDACPANFEHRYLLVEAEIFRLLGEDLKAMELYDAAIEKAHDSGYIQNEAVANECAGVFWTTRKKPEFAEIYLKKAFDGYRFWGAGAKLARMKTTYPQLFDPPDRSEAPGEVSIIRNASLTAGQLALDTIVKALQAISGEIVLEKLLGRLMNFVVMDAGADRGALFLVKKDGLFLEAEIDANKGGETQLYSIPLGASFAPHSVIRYVARTLKTIVVGSTPDAPLFDNDPYILKERPKSMLCMPVIRQKQLKAVLYMENRVVAGAFTPRRQEILRLIAAQAAISLENAILFHELNREIAERRRVEKALRQSKERFRELADLLPQMIYEADRRGKLIYLNRSGIAALGYTSFDLEQGINMKDVVIPEHHLLMETNIRKILDGETASGNPYTVKTKEGSLFPVIAYSNRILHEGEITGMRGIIIDVTDLKRTETELKNTRDYLSNLFNTLPSILLSVNRKGTIKQWNRSAEAFTGQTAKGAVGASLWDHMPFLVRYRNDLSGMFDTGKTVERYRQSLETLGKRYFDIFFYPLFQEDEEGAVIRIDDVTDLVTKDHQLHQAQKMETIGSLAGGLAHDFNNLLAGITGTLSLIKLKMELKKNISPEKFSSYLSIIENASMRAVDLVKQLQTLSRKKDLELSLFNLKTVARSVIAICKNTVDKSITIHEHYGRGRAIVAADQAQIEQVLLNLCINAAHSMTIMREPCQRQGGTLTVSVTKFHADRHFILSHPAGGEGPYWLLSVRDTGVGMAPSTIARIFDPFYTTKESGVGTGLGLSMAYRVIKQHRGFIDVYSDPGTGSTFNIFLPMAPDHETEELPEKSDRELSEGSGLILVIDDEKIIRETARGILEEAGYEVLVAENGDQGLELFGKNRKKIDCVLLDMAMPEKSGREVFLEMKQIDPGVRVLLSSGFRQDKRVQETLEKGIAGFIQKPYSMVQLVETIEKVIKR